VSDLMRIGALPGPGITDICPLTSTAPARAVPAAFPEV
jgi:hypothetical protein